MPIVALDHIQLAMPPGGEAKARQFYSDILGFPEVSKPPQLVKRGGCWFKGADIAVHLGVQPDFVPARKAHPAFRVVDLISFRKMLESAGVPITADDSLPHVRRFYAADPFGNRLEFIQDGDTF